MLAVSLSILPVCSFFPLQGTLTGRELSDPRPPHCTAPFVPRDAMPQIATSAAVTTLPTPAASAVASKTRGFGSFMLCYQASSMVVCMLLSTLSVSIYPLSVFNSSLYWLDHTAA